MINGRKQNAACVFPQIIGYLLLGILSLSGCSSQAVKSISPAVSVSNFPLSALPINPKHCRDYFAALDRIVTTRGVRDAQAATIADYPYLRVNRFLLGIAQSLEDDNANSDTAFSALVARLKIQDRLARQLELSNLSLPENQRQQQLATVTACGDVLAQQLIDNPDAWQHLLDTLTVPDEYVTWQRTVGLYWLTGWITKLAVNNYHDEARAAYAMPLSKRPKKPLVSYSANRHRARENFQHSADAKTRSEGLNPPGVKFLITRDSSNVLGIPEFTISEKKALFETFSPIWQVETEGTDDRLGAPVWHDHVSPAKIDTQHPTQYQHLSYTQFDGHVLAQLNYTVWFPARPKQGTVDVLSGHMDGITWRVTLDIDGQALLYDTMHNCGCYQQFFPTEKLRAKDAEGGLQELAFSPKNAPRLKPGERMVLRIAAVTHYLENISRQKNVTNEHVVLTTKPYQTLRSLRLPESGRRSLFGSTGIIAGTQRGERFLIWPMGVPNPGEMRQWGHHATAFLGRRHFDDTRLIPRYFIRNPLYQPASSFLQH